MEITNSLIKEAEQILLPAGMHFDEERRTFIRKLDSCDLLAVPGSGKTTAMQAKLYCISKQMPLPSGRGIAVLSHTNVAVDEIVKKLKRSCPQLFLYPNFVGTIQEFVDTFIALPIYKNIYKHGITSIDDNRYNEVVDNYHFPRSSFPTNPTFYYKCHYPDNLRNIRFNHDEENNTVITIGITGNLFSFDKPRSWINDGNADDKAQEVYDNLKRMKYRIMASGILCYDDCYFLGNVYIKENPAIKNILRKRFPYVFIDETQDLQRYQLALLDSIFNCPSVTLQRIGDINQSIFSAESKSCSSEWEIRNPIYVNRSLRLTNSVANVVNRFTAEKGVDADGNPRFVVTGSRQVGDEDIRPVLLLYNMENKYDLINKFEEIINANHLVDTAEGQKYGFHIIGWNAQAKNIEGQYHLEDLFPGYNHHKESKKKDISTLSLMLQTVAEKENFNSCYQLIFEAICRGLRIKNVKTTDGRYFTRERFLNAINEKSEEEKKEWLRLIYNNTKLLASTEYEQVYEGIKTIILSMPGEINDDLNKFLEPNFMPINSIEEDNPDQGATSIPIKISTVHAAKGRTHCATMYVETYYEGKYESQWLKKERKATKRKPAERKSIFYDDDFSIYGSYANQALKMLYVGLSRPTHLLCYASLASLWDDESKHRMEEQGWTIIIL